MTTKVLCKVDGCNKPSRSAGWCNTHYQRFYRLGDPLAPCRGKTANGTLITFLRELVSNPPQECVQWPFTTDRNGYGTICINRRKSTAHRVAWELYHKRTMRPDMQAAHAPLVCKSRSCVNPLHIREATRAENHADKVIDGTHNRGSRQWRSKLTEQQVRAIRADDRPHRFIAEAYSIHPGTVWGIKSGDRWAWLV